MDKDELHVTFRNIKTRINISLKCQLIEKKRERLGESDRSIVWLELPTIFFSFPKNGRIAGITSTISSAMRRGVFLPWHQPWESIGIMTLIPAIVTFNTPAVPLVIKSFLAHHHHQRDHSYRQVPL